MKKILTILFLTTSCSYISGPEGLFPPTKNAFLKEKVEEDMILPNDLDTIMIENHYPVEIGDTLSNDENSTDFLIKFSSKFHPKKFTVLLSSFSASFFKSE